jgi:DNA-nicking Smr family endonuclease
VHDWLAASRHAAQIAAVRGAHRRHGGGGSLYLVLRRNPRTVTVS